MATGEWVIVSRRIVLDGRVVAGAVRVRGERIVEVLEGEEAKAAGAEPGAEDVGDAIVMPGVIDAHVHVNEPGRTDWEGFETAGRAAAAGGVTMMVVMPLNCTPAATTREALEAEASAAAGACGVDFGLWGGVVPGNTDQLEAMWRAGALGFKCFMVHSGVDDFPGVSVADLEAAMPVLRGLSARGGPPLLVHAEDPAVIAAARGPSGLQGKPRAHEAWVESRPAESEVRAIATMIGLAKRFESRVHIVHVAAAEALAEIDRAKRGGAMLTAETCPHYLTFCAEEIGDGRTEFKCAPPIRGRTNREGLWDGLRRGVLDLVASDHSPCPPELKLMNEGDFARAWGGISSLQLTLPVVWTQARARGFTIEDVSRWLSAEPARLAGVEAFKGRIAPGYDADLVVFDPDAEWRVEGRRLEHRHKVTPYDGAALRGAVRATYVRGHRVWPRSARDGAGAIGRWVKSTGARAGLRG